MENFEQKSKNEPQAANTATLTKKTSHYIGDIRKFIVEKNRMYKIYSSGNYFAGATLAVVIGTDVVVVIMMIRGGSRGVAGRVAGVMVVVIAMAVVVVATAAAVADRARDACVHDGRCRNATVAVGVVTEHIRRVRWMGMASPGDCKSECCGRCSLRDNRRRRCGAILNHRRINPHSRYNGFVCFYNDFSVGGVSWRMRK